MLPGSIISTELSAIFTLWWIPQASADPHATGWTGVAGGSPSGVGAGTSMSGWGGWISGPPGTGWPGWGIGGASGGGTLGFAGGIGGSTGID
jgi:hypothetical protein